MQSATVPCRRVMCACVYYYQLQFDVEKSINYLTKTPRTISDNNFMKDSPHTYSSRRRIIHKRGEIRAHTANC